MALIHIDRYTNELIPIVPINTILFDWFPNKINMRGITQFQPKKNTCNKKSEKFHQYVNLWFIFEVCYFFHSLKN